jgi:SAM-dependent MidA family methyltransferase
MAQRDQGTLRCYYQHRAHENPFFWPGLQDITSHVDFTAVAQSGVNAGLELQGFTSQAHFLMATSLLEHASCDGSNSVIKAAQISREIQQLTLPCAMGESFCAIGFSKNIETVMKGFIAQDQSHRL